MRIGFGYDSHRFANGGTLILAGVEIAGSPGLTGHSDADVVAHAVTDAILGAAAAGDIGTHFPPDDDTWKDADSIELLVRATDIVRDAGYRVGNVDVTVICERPRISQHRATMAARLAEALGVGPGDVSVKGKTNETMGWEGQGEGIAVHAVAILFSANDA
jgi:2-C-methyl-D-erythritol 2,4-cyclodiphosphate synthase